MATRSLLIIILKVLGLFFVKDFLPLIPQFLSLFSLFITYFEDGIISPIVASFLSLFLYGYFAYVLLFKTEWVIDKLRLEQGIESENWSFKLHRSVILQISTIIIGALIIVNAVPDLLRQLFLYVQHIRSQGGLLDYNPKPDYTLLIIYTVQILIGLLILGYQRRIAVYIEFKRRKQQ
jgi:hypothetical protein